MPTQKLQPKTSSRFLFLVLLLAMTSAQVSAVNVIGGTGLERVVPAVNVIGGTGLE